MKNLKEYLIKESTLDVDDVVDAIASYLDGDDFPLDAHGSRTGSGWKAAKKNGYFEVIDFCCGWEELADELDVDEDELSDFIDDNYEEIEKALDNYNK